VRKFTVEDTNPMSYEEFGKLMETLKEKVSEYFAKTGEKIDIIAPLHRTGAIPGGILSVDFKVVPLYPVQFKYFYHPTEIKQIISLPDILLDVPLKPNILMTEGNTSTGGIAQKAASALHEKFPGSKIYLATVTKVFGGPEKIDGIENIFYGVQTDENFIATPEEQERLKLRKGITIFPWESAEEEVFDINSI
jgi:hypothetical protein